MSEREFVSIHVSEQHPGVGTLLLARTPSNAMTRQVYREIVSAAQEVSDRPDIATVILFGGHDIFSAGDDIAELGTLDRREVELADGVRRQALHAVASIAKPTVAAITGYALGSGLSLALAADWRVSGDNVKFGATEVLSGLIPGGGGCTLLARTVGPALAKELAFSGRFVGAEEALKVGLVDELVAPDHVFDAAATWATRFVHASPAALAGVKALVNGGLDASEEARRYSEVFAARTAAAGGR